MIVPSKAVWGFYLFFAVLSGHIAPFHSSLWASTLCSTIWLLSKKSVHYLDTFLETHSWLVQGWSYLAPMLQQEPLKPQILKPQTNFLPVIFEHCSEMGRGGRGECSCSKDNPHELQCLADCQPLHLFHPLVFYVVWLIKGTCFWWYF